jgi:hypothetical protein
VGVIEAASWCNAIRFLITPLCLRTMHSLRILDLNSIELLLSLPFLGFSHLLDIFIIEVYFKVHNTDDFSNLPGILSIFGLALSERISPDLDMTKILRSSGHLNTLFMRSDSLDA